MLIGAAYRVWSGISQERDNLSAIIDQLEMANGTKGDCMLLGDLNLDVYRANNADYNRKPLLESWTTGFKATGFSLCHTEATWRSHGLFINPANPAVTPVLYSGSRLHSRQDCGRGCGGEQLHDQSRARHGALTTRLTKKTKVVIKRCNIKKISPTAFEAALMRSWDWLATHALTDVNKVLEQIIGGVLAALDIVAPLRSIIVRRGKNLYLAADTLAVINRRDKANRADYRLLRNRASVLLRQGKRRSNMALLKKAKGDSRALWELANDAIGKRGPTLPKAIEISDDAKLLTVGPAEVANRMHDYYIKKSSNYGSGTWAALPLPQAGLSVGTPASTTAPPARLPRWLRPRQHHRGRQRRRANLCLQERCKGAGRTYSTFSQVQL
jgi:hypothetical protein